MPGFVDRALHPASGRFKWLIAAIFLSPVAGYVSTAIVAVTALIEALRWRDIASAISASRAARITATAFLIFFLSIFLSNLFHERGHRWWNDSKYLLPIAGPLLLYLRFSEMKTTLDDIGRLALIAACVTILVVFGQHLYYALVLNVPGWRSAALSGNTLFVSAMFVPMLFLSWLGFEKRSARSQMLTGFVFIAGIAATVIALGARASLIIIVLMMPFLLLFVLSRLPLSLPRKIATLLIAVGALGVVAALTSITNPSATDRFKSLAAASLSSNFAAANTASGGRMQNWQAAWRAVQDRPLTGYGFRKDAVAIAKYLPKDSVLVTAHQQYLSFGITAGIFGLLAGIAYLALPIINVFAAPASDRSGQRYYAGIALAAPIMLNGLTDTIFDDMRIQGFYSVMTVLLLCARSHGERTVASKM